MKEIKLGYTVILHSPRMRHGLSLNEYAVASMIYHLSHNPKAPVPGWCTAGRATLGAYIGVTRQTAITIIKKLIAGGLVTVEPELQYLKTTDLWFDDFEHSNRPETGLHPVQNFNRGCKETLQGGSKETLHNNNTLFNTNNNIEEDTPSWFLKTFNRITKKAHRSLPPKAESQLKRLLKSGYLKSDIEKTVEAAAAAEFHIKNNYNYLTPEYITRPDKFDIFFNSKNNGQSAGNNQPGKTPARTADSGGKKVFD